MSIKCALETKQCGADRAQMARRLSSAWISSGKPACIEIVCFLKLHLYTYNFVCQFHRLGLERADTAEKAVTVITELLEKYGQGGSCMEDESSFTYHNSFLISDRKEAWLLETSGKYWAAERVEGNWKEKVHSEHNTSLANSGNTLGK